MSGLRSDFDFTHFGRISALLLFGRWWRQDRYFTIVDRLVFGRISTSSIFRYWCRLDRYVTPCRLFGVRSALDIAHCIAWLLDWLFVCLLTGLLLCQVVCFLYALLLALALVCMHVILFSWQFACLELVQEVVCIEFRS